MQLSKQEIDQQVEKEMLHAFYQLISDIKNPEEATIVLSSLLTKVEIKTFAKRIAVAQLLREKASYDKIRKQLKVSSATIASIQSKIDSDPNMKLLFGKIDAEEWANKWTQRITNIIGA